jgi:hypothetical protein
VFAIILASTVALSAFQGAASSIPASTRAGVEPAPANRLPTIVHIILDEHIGIEGIPVEVRYGRETKSLLKSFFPSYGFRLFGRAYSRYEMTRDSIPHTLNYPTRPHGRALVDGNEPFVLRANKYFEEIHEAGYAIHAFQTKFIDLCRPIAHILTTCYTEDHGLKILEEGQYSLMDRSILLYQEYARLSVVNRAFYTFNSDMRALAARNHWKWPDLWLAGVGMPMADSMHLMSVLSDQVAHSAPGEFLFAHLMLPHYPYMYDTECKARNWKKIERAFDARPLPPNTTELREQRYTLYLEQVQCVMRKLRDMFEKWQKAGVYENLLIIIHGDHGPRIYRHRPEVSNLEEMLISDYADAFSTLLAIKAPGHQPGYDLQWVAIQEVLPWLTGGQSARPISGSESLPYVFLRGDGPGGLVKQPLPSFGDGSDVVNHRDAPRGLAGKAGG